MTSGQATEQHGIQLPGAPEASPGAAYSPSQHLAQPYREGRTDQLDIRRQLHTVRKHLVWVVVMSLVSSAAAAVIGLTGSSPWQATTTLQVRREPYSRTGDALTTVLAEESIGRSLSNSLEADKAAAALINRGASVTVKVQGSNELLLTVEGKDSDANLQLAELAPHVFNARVGEIVNVEVRRLEGQKEDRERELVAVASDLQKARRVRRRLSDIQSEQERERINSETLSARLAAMRGSGSAAPPATSATEQTAELKRHKLIEQIVALEMQQADMLNRYQPGHPQLEAVSAKLGQLRAELDKLAPHAGDELRAAELALLESRARQQVLDAAAKDLAEAGPGADRDEVALQIRQTVLNQEVVALTDRIGRLEAAKAVPPMSVTARPESRPPQHWSHRLIRAVPFGLLLGLVMGVFFALGVEHLRDTCTTPGEVFTDLGLPTLAIMPRLPVGDAAGISSSDPHSELAEMFSILRNNIRYSAANSPQKLVMITSPMAGDGKSMIAMNLAVSYAFEGLSVLLVDADMRRSKGYGLLLADEGQPGLVTWLEGAAASPEEVITTSGEPGLWVLPAGGKAANATKLVSSPRMAELLHWAQEHYDVVVVDTPAVLPVADTTIFAHLARAVLVVIDASSTRSGAARAAVSRLTHVHGNVVGAVLNRADQRAMGYMSYYGGGYGMSYGYSSYS